MPVLYSAHVLEAATALPWKAHPVLHGKAAAGSMSLLRLVSPLEAAPV